MKIDWLKILNRFSLDEQIKHWFGEVYELVQAIERDDGSLESREHIIEEIADNRNFLGQIQTHFNISDEEVEKVQVFKNKRTLKEIENENNK